MKKLVLIFLAAVTIGLTTSCSSCKESARDHRRHAPRHERVMKQKMRSRHIMRDRNGMQHRVEKKN